MTIQSGKDRVEKMKRFICLACARGLEILGVVCGEDDYAKICKEFLKEVVKRPDTIRTYPSIGVLCGAISQVISMMTTTEFFLHDRLLHEFFYLKTFGHPYDDIRDDFRQIIPFNPLLNHLSTGMMNVVYEANRQQDTVYESDRMREFVSKMVKKIEEIENCGQGAIESSLMW